MYNPYNWVREDFSYYIETDRKVKYKLYFDDATNLFAGQTHGCTVLSFSIEVVGNASTAEVAEDSRIADTVHKLLSEFFEDDEGTLIVIYDTIDGRGYARKRKFNRWFEKHNINHVEKWDYEIVDEETSIPNSLLIHKGHPFKEVIIKAYEKLVNNGGYLE